MSEGRTGFVAGFLASVLAVAAAYASAFLPGGPPGWAPWLMVAGVAGSLVTVMALGAWRGGSVGPLAPVFGFVFAVLVGGFGAALELPGAGADGLWLGLPPGAAVVLYGVGLLPLFVVPVAYALSFDRFTLDDEDWERVRSVRTEDTSSPSARDGGSGPGAGPEGREG